MLKKPYAIKEKLKLTRIWKEVYESCCTKCLYEFHGGCMLSHSKKSEVDMYRFCTKVTPGDHKSHYIHIYTH